MHWLGMLTVGDPGGARFAGTRRGARRSGRQELSAETLIKAARAALAKGNLEDAEFLLDGVRPGEGNVDDLDFLHGTIAAKRGDWESAITRFRAMLARDPELPRVRLDLALAYFQARQDGSAAYHFRQALGDDSLPPAARARALAFLDADPPPQVMVAERRDCTRTQRQH